MVAVPPGTDPAAPGGGAAVAPAGRAPARATLSARLVMSPAVEDDGLSYGAGRVGPVSVAPGSARPVSPGRSAGPVGAGRPAVPWSAQM